MLRGQIATSNCQVRGTCSAIGDFTRMARTSDAAWGTGGGKSKGNLWENHSRAFEVMFYIRALMPVISWSASIRKLFRSQEAKSHS